MFFKIVGVVLITITTTLLGMYNSAKIKFRIEDLYALRNALSILKSEISYGTTILSLAAKNISVHNKNVFIRQMFERFEKLLTERQCEVAKDAWLLAIDYACAKSYLAYEDFTMLKSFGNAISIFDIQFQSNTLDMITNYINSKTSELEAEYLRHRKLYGNLGFLFGLLIAVIFI